MMIFALQQHKFHNLWIFFSKVALVCASSRSILELCEPSFTQSKYDKQKNTSPSQLPLSERSNYAEHQNS
jgi:hypothetical protein